LRTCTDDRTTRAEQAVLTDTERGDERMSGLLIGREPRFTRLESTQKADAGAVRWLVAALVVSLGLLLLLIGGVYLVADRTQRDADGYLMNPATKIATDTAALVADSVRAGGDGVRYDISGDIKLEADSAKRVFVGIAAARSVERYLAGVPVERVRELGDAGGTALRGSSTPAPPASQGFWVASSTGSREQTLRWDSADGDWRVVVMNADGSRGVKAAIRAGARHPSLIYFGVGVGLLAAGAALIAAAVAIMPRRSGRACAPPHGVICPALGGTAASRRSRPARRSDQRAARARRTDPSCGGPVSK
jgi:hypothetical protein